MREIGWTAGVGRRRPSRDGRAAVRRRASAHRHTRAQSRPGLRCRAWIDHGRRRHPVAAADRLLGSRAGRPRSPMGIYQKQTGADRLSLGGALACNAHGRGLTLKPIVQQVEAFDLVDASGTFRTCSRAENPDLFRLAIGGYGLFGIVIRVRLTLRPRVKVRRVVALGETANIIDRFEERIRDGYLYGDYQFTTDSDRDSFLRRGVFSCYEP